MANIESKLTTIRSASGGEDVRDAIIGALRDINNDVPADMSNPKQKEYNMPAGSDLTVPINPPELISQIIVRQPNTGGKSMTTPDITITENGEYPADDPSYDPDEEIRYYSKVTVKVPQLANAVMDLEEEITQNGTYSAPADWGVDGLRTFTVNVSGASGDGPFTVEFYESESAVTPRETQLVPAYGTAISQFTPTAPAGQHFAGWNPSPTSVTRNLKCYPRFVDTSVIAGEIEDSWDVICSKGGAGYPLGSFKSLSIRVTCTKEEFAAYGIDLDALGEGYSEGDIFFNDAIFYKVAEGESGSKSTWLSRPITVYWKYSEKYGNHVIPGPFGHHTSFNWPDRYERKFLNLLSTKMGTHFTQHIADVVKYTQCSTASSAPYHVVPTNERIWIPSIKEIYIDGWDTNNISKDKYVTNVSGGMAYMNDVLALNPKQRHDALLLGGTTTYFRDAGWIWDQSPEMDSGSDYEGENVWIITGGVRHDGGCIPSMLGFCLV